MYKNDSEKVPLQSSVINNLDGNIEQNLTKPTTNSPIQVSSGSGQKKNKAKLAINSLDYYKSKYANNGYSERFNVLKKYNLAFKNLDFNLLTFGNSPIQLSKNDLISEIESIFDKRASLQKNYRNSGKNNDADYGEEFIDFPVFVISFVFEKYSNGDGVRHTKQQILNQLWNSHNYQTEEYTAEFFCGQILGDNTYEDLVFYLMLREFVRFYIVSNSQRNYYQLDGFHKLGRKILQIDHYVVILKGIFHLFEKDAYVTDSFILSFENRYTANSGNSKHNATRISIYQFLKDCVEIYKKLKVQTDLVSIVKDLEEGHQNHKRTEKKLQDEKLNVFDKQLFSLAYPELVKNNRTEEELIEEMFGFFGKNNSKVNQIKNATTKIPASISNTDKSDKNAKQNSTEKSATTKNNLNKIPKLKRQATPEKSYSAMFARNTAYQPPQQQANIDDYNLEKEKEQLAKLKEDMLELPSAKLEIKFDSMEFPESSGIAKDRDISLQDYSNRNDEDFTEESSLDRKIFNGDKTSKDETSKNLGTEDREFLAEIQKIKDCHTMFYNDMETRTLMYYFFC